MIGISISIGLSIHQYCYAITNNIHIIIILIIPVACCALRAVFGASDMPSSICLLSVHDPFGHSFQSQH